jgi:hypothetical protein
LGTELASLSKVNIWVSIAPLQNACCVPTQHIEIIQANKLDRDKMSHHFDKRTHINAIEKFQNGD